MPYYNSGDLLHYITKYFYNIDWNRKLSKLKGILIGLNKIHITEIIHRDLHSGNIFLDGYEGVVIGDLGISKSATESAEDRKSVV